MIATDTTTQSPAETTSAPKAEDLFKSPTPADDADSDDGDEDTGVAMTNGAYTPCPTDSLKVNDSGLGDAKKKKKKKKPKKKKLVQSEPPRIGLGKLFPSGIYPEGEIQEYKNE
jgi:hypothetical protein